MIANPGRGAAPSDATFLDARIASDADRRRLGVLCAAYLLVGLSCLSFAARPMREVPQITTIYATVVVLTDVCTYALLVSQYRAEGTRWVLALACAYLYSGAMAAVHLLSFSGAVLRDTALIGGPQTVGIMYVAWSSGFALMLAGVVWMWVRADDSNVRAQRGGRHALAATVAVLAAVAAMVVAVVLTESRLPIEISGGRFASWAVQANFMRSVVSLVSLYLLWRHRKRLNFVMLWLGLALVAAAIGPLLTDVGARRYTFGWYAGRASFAFASSVLLIALLHEFARLQRELARAFGQLAEQSATLQEEGERRRAAERKLAIGQRLESIGQLAAGIAHDFNNLLTTIIANLELIGRVSADPQVAAGVERARRSASRGAALTRNLLAFGQRQPLQMQELDIGLLLRAFAPDLQHAVGNPCRLELAIEPDLWRCRLDPEQLEHAVLNLALNARDAMPEGGVLRLSASNVEGRPGAAGESAVTRSDHVVLAMQDRGIGIPADRLDRVFEPFFTTKTFGSGSGLGLSQVHGFMMQSGGEVTITSEAGRGSVVRMLIPRAFPTSATTVSTADHEP